jgi:DNA (cytosine-5)-methyltransferase 1
LDSSDTAVATARLAGHTSHPADVAHILPWHFAGIVGLIASPPCQTFSVSGAGAGRRDLDLVLAVVREVAHGEIVDPAWFEDPRTALVVEPLRWALACRPEWVALEQVPSVRPVWEAIAHELRKVGYSVAVGIVKAEQHGVAQTRRRAVLVASRVKQARLPVPSFQEFRMEHLRPDLPRWFSMAVVLGWGATGRPSMTVTGGGSDTGGAEPFGTGAREGLRREQVAGRWVFRNNNRPNSAERDLGEPAGTVHFGERINGADWVMRSNYKDGDRPDLRAIRQLDEPSVTLTGRPPQWAMETANGPVVTYRDGDEPAATLTGGAGSLVFRNTNRERACERTPDEPAGVIYGGHAASAGEWALRSSVSDAGYAKTVPRHLDEPAATITSKHRSAEWVLEHSRPGGNVVLRPAVGGRTGVNNHLEQQVG